MIRTFTATLAALLLATAAQAVTPAKAPAATTAKIGEQAPNFVTTDALNGTPLELAKLKGKPVVLEWNNFGCPFVQKHYGSGNMQKLQREAVEGGAVWISINSSAEGKQGFLKDSEAVKAAVKEHDAAPSHYVRDTDGKIGRSYGATTTPHMYVIDKNGVLAYEGAIDDKPTPSKEDVATAKNYVREALAALAAGKAVSPSHTKAYGCGVKYDF